MTTSGCSYQLSLPFSLLQFSDCPGLTLNNLTNPCHLTPEFSLATSGSLLPRKRRGPTSPYPVASILPHLASVTDGATARLRAQPGFSNKAERSGQSGAGMVLIQAQGGTRPLGLVWGRLGHWVALACRLIGSHLTILTATAVRPATRPTSPCFANHDGP